MSLSYSRHINTGTVRRKPHLLGWNGYAGPGETIVFDQMPVWSLKFGMVVMHHASLVLMMLQVGWTSSKALRKILLVVSAQQGGYSPIVTIVVIIVNTTAKGRSNGEAQQKCVNTGKYAFFISQFFIFIFYLSPALPDDDDSGPHSCLSWQRGQQSPPLAASPNDNSPSSSDNVMMAIPSFSLIQCSSQSSQNMDTLCKIGL